VYHIAQYCETATPPQAAFFFCATGLQNIAARAIFSWGIPWAAIGGPDADSHENKGGKRDHSSQGRARSAHTGTNFSPAT